MYQLFIYSLLLQMKKNSLGFHPQTTSKREGDTYSISTSQLLDGELDIFIDVVGDYL